MRRHELATSVVALVDRLVLRCDVIEIEADSYGVKEAKERSVSKFPRRKNVPHVAKVRDLHVTVGRHPDRLGALIGGITRFCAIIGN